MRSPGVYGPGLPSGDKGGGDKAQEPGGLCAPQSRGGGVGRVRAPGTGLGDREGVGNGVQGSRPRERD